MINRITLLGRVGEGATMRMTQDGRNVATLRLATHEKYKDKELTEWHNLVIFDPIAKSVGQYLTKGRLLYIEGKYTTRTYDKDNVKQYRAEVIVNVLKLIGPSNQTAAIGVAPQLNNSESSPVSSTSSKKGHTREQFDSFLDVFPGAYESEVPF